MNRPTPARENKEQFFIGEARQPDSETAFAHKERVKEAAVTVEIEDGSVFYYERAQEKTNEALVAHDAFYQINDGGSLSIFHTRTSYKNNVTNPEKSHSRVITFGPGAWFSVKGVGKV